MASQNGGMPVDPEEMQALLEDVRNKGKKPMPPAFMRLMMPLKSFTNFRENDGFHFGFGVPITQKFQCSTQWIFSNKKPATFEFVSILLGEGNPMAQDEMSMV